ncbi:MAG TPA: thio(seleno)oxazole modification radical SAM maturase SbtM [bacterium]
MDRNGVLPRAATFSGVREALAAVSAAAAPPRWAPGERPELNPTLRLVQAGDGLLLVWRPPLAGQATVRAAEPRDLLVLKIVAGRLPVAVAAAAAALCEGDVEALLAGAAGEGLVLAPRPLVRRGDGFPAGELADPRYRESATFTLQWHLTQDCDLRCRHCYDRSERPGVPREQALGVLEDLRRFCRARRVAGVVSFSGGNPLLHPHFLELYAAAAGHGFGVGVLGNPSPRRRIEEMLAVRAPLFFQVSLEGLPGHNDWVRGAGHFARTEEFLRHLRDLGVPAAVMLTLTDANVDQVLPLAARLRGLVDVFQFNRLAMVGEGAALRLPSRERYERFLEEYVTAAAADPALGVKDNLAAIVLRRRGEPPSGGCTGCGCGAAFDFLALLPDGEAHACRKFPSPVGDVVREGIAAVYDSEAARRYRAGCAACAGCPIRPVCGGCMAVAHGFGLDPLRERDPMCFADGGRSRAQAFSVPAGGGGS